MEHFFKENNITIKKVNLALDKLGYIIYSDIKFDEILIGRSFSLSDDTYYVLYYEFEDEEISSDLSSLAYNYRSSSKEISLYTVNMSDAFNSSFLSDESNKDATKASELKISGPTLIKFVDGKISRYVEDMNDIESR